MTKIMSGISIFLLLAFTSFEGEASTSADEYIAGHLFTCTRIQRAVTCQGDADTMYAYWSNSADAQPSIERRSCSTVDGGSVRGTDKGQGTAHV